MSATTTTTTTSSSSSPPPPSSSSSRQRRIRPHSFPSPLSVSNIRDTLLFDQRQHKLKKNNYRIKVRSNKYRKYAHLTNALCNASTSWPIRIIAAFIFLLQLYRLVSKLSSNNTHNYLWM